jgi:cellulose synthase (UDP-forming)
MLSPLLYLMFGLEIYRMNLLEFFAYVVPHVVASSMLSTQIYGRVRWVLFSELYEYIQSIYLSRAMLAVIRSPRSPSFNVTSKGQVVGSAQLSPLGKPFVIIALLLMIGVVLTIWRAFAQPEARDILTAVGLWNLGNLVVALAAVGVVYERHQMRLKPRLARSCPASVVLPGGTEAIPATVVDSSAGGLRLRIPLDRMNCQLEKGDRIAVAMTMPGMDAAKVAVSVRFLDEESELVLVGGSYIVQPDVEKTDAVHVSFGDSRVWRRWWDHRHANQPGTIRGLYFFVSLAFGQGLPALMAISRSAFSRTDARIEQR